MINQNYLAKREQWRAMIRQRDDRSEIVNYDDTIDSEEYEQCYYREQALEETKKVVY